MLYEANIMEMLRSFISVIVNPSFNHSDKELNVLAEIIEIRAGSLKFGSHKNKKLFVCLN